MSQIRREAERQALTHLSAEQDERKRLAQQSEQLVQSVQAHQATLHELQEQQTEHSAKRLAAPLLLEPTLLFGVQLEKGQGNS